MVGHPPLREIVGADALGAVARADLALAVGGARRRQRLPLRLVEPGAQHLQGARLVLVLRFLVLLNDDEPGRQMRDPDRAVGRVDRLAAWPRRPENVDAQILVVDLDVDLLGLGQYRDGRGRGVDAARGFGFRDALDAVDAGFEFEAGEDIAPGDRGRRLLDAAESRVGQVEQLEAPALQRRIALVHPKKLSSKQGGFFAPRPGAHFEDGVALVILVARQQRRPDLRLQFGEALLDAAHFLFGERLQFGIGVRLGHLLRGGQFALGAAQGLDTLDDRRQLTVFLGKLDEIAAGQRAARKRMAEFVAAPHELVETRFERRFHAGVPQPASALRRAGKSPSGTSSCAPLSRSRNVAAFCASSLSPISTAARAPIRSARRMRRCRLPL